jgi:putative ABC transport system permease protein
MLVLLALTGLVLRAGRVPAGRAPVVAVARATVQLGVVAVLLRGVITAPAAVGVVLAVMLSTAVRTAARRLPDTPRAWQAVGLACGFGAGSTLLVIFLLGVLPADPRYLVACGGIVIGAAMTGTTLAGRRLREGLVARREEVEAWLALGATMRYAVADVARHAASEALIPALDQTRTTGLVTQPDPGRPLPTGRAHRRTHHPGHRSGHPDAPARQPGRAARPRRRERWTRRMTCATGACQAV